MKAPDIITFTKDPRFLGLAISPAQEALLRTVYGLKFANDEQREIARLCLHRSGDPPPGGFGEVTVLAGARSGKDSRIAAPVVVYEALFGGHERHLGRGERATIALVAQDSRATAIAFDLVRAYLEGSRLLSTKIEDVLANTITLTNRTSIVCFPSTKSSLRGWSIPVAVLDEVAYWRLEGSADSDAEIQASIRRGGVNFPHPRIVKISTPYLRSGILYSDFKESFGKPDPDRIVWRATTALMNPRIDDARLERERRLDRVRYSREYEAEFADDVASFLPAAWIEAAVVEGRHQLPPVEGVTYYAALDSAGAGVGKDADAFTLSVCHCEGVDDKRRVIHDLMKGWRGSRSHPMNLEAIVAEIAAILKTFGLYRVEGDAYGAGWAAQTFPRHHLEYVKAATDKSGAFLAVEPLFATGRIEILDHEALIHELRNLERRPQPGGAIKVSHPQSASLHDDHATSLALAAAHFARTLPRVVVSLEGAYMSGASVQEREDRQDHEGAVADPGGSIGDTQRRNKRDRFFLPPRWRGEELDAEREAPVERSAPGAAPGLSRSGRILPDGW